MSRLFDFKLVIEYFPQILSRLHITLIIVITATLFGVILGTLIALIRIHRIPVFNQTACVFVSFIRGTPIIIQLFIVYFGLPMVLLKIGIDIVRWDEFYFVLVTYILNASAFLSEIIRAAIQGVDVGQSEAAYSVGLTKFQTFYRITAPQALATALPSFSANTVNLLQNTSLGFTIGVIDLIGKVKAIGVRTYHTVEGYIGAAIIFVILSLALQKLFNYLEIKVNFYQKQGKRQEG